MRDWADKTYLTGAQDDLRLRRLLLMAVCLLIAAVCLAIVQDEPPEQPACMRTTT